MRGGTSRFYDGAHGYRMWWFLTGFYSAALGALFLASDMPVRGFWGLGFAWLCWITGAFRWGWAEQ